MPRHARQKSETGIYHIILRGINRQAIFKDEADRHRLFHTIKKYKDVSNYQIYGYCFMDNHVHLLLKETTEPLFMAIKRMSGSYVFWFNWKYDRCGHLFQERYKSEAVEDDSYFLTVLRYIHQNPVKACITKKVSDYKWSSYHEYINESIMTDVDLALEMFSPDRQKAIEQFIPFTNQQNDDSCIDYDENVRITDSEIKAILLQFGISNINELQRLDKNKRYEIIKAIKSVGSVTVRQLAKITGMSKSTISRI
ncbi:MAG: transposase [Bacillota bacterium]